MGYVEFVNKLMGRSPNNDSESSEYQADTIVLQNANGKTGYQAIILRNGSPWQHEVNYFGSIGSHKKKWTFHLNEAAYPWIRNSERSALRSARAQVRHVKEEAWTKT